MMKTLMRIAGGAAVLALIALFGRGAIQPASADPYAVVMFNPTICAAVGGEPFLPGCAINAHGLEYASGDGQLLQAADRLGNNDGKITPSDFKNVADFTGGQIHQQGGSVSPSFSKLVVVAFVASDGPVTFHTTAGTFDESGAATYTCDGNIANPNADTDCDGVPSGAAPGSATAEDHAVVAYLSCTLATCPTRGTANLTVEQGSIVFPTTFTVVGEARTVQFFTLEQAVQAGVPVNGALTTDSAKAACPFSASLPFITKALAEAEKTVIVARALDIDGTKISGAWFTWSVDPAATSGVTSFDTQGILAQPITPTLNLGSFGYGAPNILCAPADAVKGTVTVRARLTRQITAQNFDPFSDPGDPATNLAFGDTTFNVNAIPAAMTLTAVPASVPCDGTATSTVSAAIVDAAGNPAISGTAVHFEVQVLGTANPINTTTDGKGVATSVISPLAGDVRGVPVTVSVQAGGVTQDAMTQSIMILCSGAAPAAPGAPGGGAPPPAGGGGGTGTIISGPNTGTGGVASRAAGASGRAWLLATVLTAAGVVALAGGAAVSRRRS